MFGNYYKNDLFSLEAGGFIVYFGKSNTVKKCVNSFDGCERFSAHLFDANMLFVVKKTNKIIQPSSPAVNTSLLLLTAWPQVLSKSVTIK